ncbi:MAG: SRPBCC domain-containing protein [Sphingobacteriales bacterium]|nr:MAG: SRPBCC domain-containing protein [Sphingobacteriales bacterium]
MKQDFTTTIMVDQTPDEVYETILDVRSWWSGLYAETFTGSSEKIGDEFTFQAGGGAHHTKQRLTELEAGRKVVWLVTEANLSFTDKKDEWVGTKISFEIYPEAGRTRIVFTHLGLIPSFECYDSCAPAWTQYVQERLVAALSATN